MNVEELKQKIENRERAVKTLSFMEGRYYALLKNIEEHGEDCVIANITFNSPEGLLNFDMTGMPPIAANMISGAISESIAIQHRYIEGIEDDLKGIVEFTD